MTICTPARRRHLPAPVDQSSLPRHTMPTLLIISGELHYGIGSGLHVITTSVVTAICNPGQIFTRCSASSRSAMSQNVGELARCEKYNKSGRARRWDLVVGDAGFVCFGKTQQRNALQTLRTATDGLTAGGIRTGSMLFPHPLLGGRQDGCGTRNSCMRCWAELQVSVCSSF